MDFLTQNPGIAKGLLRTAHAKQQTKRKWDEIAVSLNALGGAQKDGKGWAKVPTVYTLIHFFHSNFMTTITIINW